MPYVDPKSAIQAAPSVAEGEGYTMPLPRIDATPQSSDLDPAGLRHEPDLLHAFRTALEATGYVGEERLTKLLYLAVTSRLFTSPVSVAVKGPSSGGKSFAVQQTLEFFPAEAYFAMTSMSDKALYYLNEPLSNRFLVLYEFSGMSGGSVEYAIRSLLSEGRLSYLTVDKTDGQLSGRTIHREGPTGLLVTTTLSAMHPENETRYLSVSVEDSPEQTMAIMLATAGVGEAQDIDQEAWHGFQRWLAAEPVEVAIPYARELVELIPPVATRLRRDVPKLLTLVKAHALLHRGTRTTDEEGRILAEVADYAAVFELTADLIETGVEASVPRDVRETVDAVAHLTQGRPAGQGATGMELAKALGRDKSTSSRRARVAIEGGYLANLELSAGKQLRLVVGEPLPDDDPVIPTPDAVAEAVRRCTVAAFDEGSPGAIAA